MSNKSDATTKFYMNQANKIVDVLSEILPKIYYSAFNDQFDVFMDNLWEKPDENHGPILDKMALESGETPEVLERINWNKLSKERKMEWLKRMDVQALLKALRFRPKSLDIFCEKNSLVKSKMINVLQAMINWRNYGVGHKTIFKYEKMDEKIFKLNILEPVWEFYDLLSRYYTIECDILHKTLQEIEIRMKYSETSIERLVKLSKKSEEKVREALKILKIYSDEDGKIKGEDEYKLAENIRRLSKKDSIQQVSNKSNDSSESTLFDKKRVLVILVSVIGLVAVTLLLINVINSFSYSTVPKVTGMNVEKASAELKKVDLKPIIKYEDKIGCEKNTVLKQDKQPNEKVKKDQEVHIYVCSGKVTVPNLNNKKMNQAKKIVVRNGLKPTIKKEFSSNVNKNRIISQQPKNGVRIDENSEVILTVSKGKEKIIVPDLTDKSTKSAKKVLKEKGLKVEVNQEYSSVVIKGRVTRTAPSKDSKVKKGNLVTIFISKGPEPVSNTNNYSKPSQSNNKKKSNKNKYPTITF